MPHFEERNVGPINWDLVNGRSQTIPPPGTPETGDIPFSEERDTWFRHIFRERGTPPERNQRPTLHYVCM